MKRSIIQSATLALVLLLSAGLSLAEESKAETPAEAKAAGAAKTADKSSKPKSARPAAKVKLVDINSAGKAELKKLPGIGDAAADKIIAGRPYLSKANLLTHNIVSRDIYDGIKTRVIARQNKASEAKLEAKIREKQEAALKAKK